MPKKTPKRNAATAEAPASPTSSQDGSQKGSPTRKAKSDTYEVTALLKIVPQLSEVGYDGWLKAIQLVAYSEEWYEDVTVDGEEPAGWQPSDFDPAKTDKKSKRNQKNNVLHPHVQDLQRA